MVAIDDNKERKRLSNWIRKRGKEIISISEDQVAHFAGNMIQVLGKNEERYLVMSSSAYESLNKNQIKKLEKHNQIVFSDIQTIETCGGVSVRCMMGEVFL